MYLQLMEKMTTTTRHWMISQFWPKLCLRKLLVLRLPHPVVICIKLTSDQTVQVHDLGVALGYPTLPFLIRFFLYDCLSPNAQHSGFKVGIDACPLFNGNIHVFPSAIATFYAPSDPLGPRGMHHEQIRSVASWRGGAPHRDCVYIEKDSTLPGFQGLHVARALLLFSFVFQRSRYECALVSWYVPVGTSLDRDTRLWVVTPERDAHRQLRLEVVSLGCMVWAAHLIGVAGDDLLPPEVSPDNSLNVFRQFYVNKYADYHAHEIANLLLAHLNQSALEFKSSIQSVLPK